MLEFSHCLGLEPVFYCVLEKFLGELHVPRLEDSQLPQPTCSAGEMTAPHHAEQGAQHVAASTARRPSS